MSNFSKVYAGDALSVKKDNDEWYIAELICLERRKENVERIHYYYVSKFIDQECIIPIPKKMPPTYYGENFSIKWYLNIYNQKIKKVYEQELYVLTKTDNLKEEIIDYNIFKIIFNQNITPDQKISLEFDKKIIINNSKIILKEILDFKFEKDLKIIYPKLEEVSDTNFNLIINEKLPSTFLTKFSSLICELILDLQYQDKYFTNKINLNIFDKLEAYGNLTPMEKLILNYIKNYGPMTIGKLIMMISYGEKMRVKSKEILNACEKLVKEKKLIREGYGPLTSKYYLST
ncbi:MAG: hypothetical protein ACO2OV_02900 [Thermoproteota archaeon]|jgi:hypothetical protein